MYDITDFDELRRGINRTILVRRITLGVFSGVALVVLFASRISYLNPVFYSPLVWFLLTFPFKYLIDRQRTLRTLHWVHTGFFLVEVLLITFLVHFMGGSEWIGVTFYMFTVIYANIFLTRFQGSLVTLLVVLSYSGLVLLEYTGLIPHRSLFSAVGEPHRSLGYALTTILAGALGMYAVVALTVRSFADVFVHKNRMLARRERQLSRLSRRLLTAQDEERRRIARTLHDDLIQTLAAIKLRLTPQKDRLGSEAVSYTHLRAHETLRYLGCRLLLRRSREPRSSRRREDASLGGSRRRRRLPPGRPAGTRPSRHPGAGGAQRRSVLDPSSCWRGYNRCRGGPVRCRFESRSSMTTG